MKYLITILSIVGVITAISLFVLWPKNQQLDADIAVTVNGHNLSRAALADNDRKSSYHNDSKDELLDSAITRELLLQEAQRQAIDKEASFRTALTSFYEQSLIKILLDRQYNKTQVHVAEEEIDNFLACFGKRVIFSRLTVADTTSSNISSKQGQQTSAIFDDLAAPVQVLLASLKPGGFAIKYDTGSDQYAIRLDSIVDTIDANNALPDRDAVQQLLIDHKREQQINIWLNDLRKSASITIHNK
jgi:hypothetical protein